MDTVPDPLPALWHDAPTIVVADRFQHAGISALIDGASRTK
jgi:hypothetical protein